MGRDTLRMGEPQSKGSFKPVILFIVLGVLVVGSIAYLLWGGGPKEAEKKVGCEQDSDCRPGSMCAAGGCIIMLSSESADMWRDDIAAQLDAGVKWSPLAAYGEKIIPATTCPAKAGEVKDPLTEQVIPKTSVFVYEVSDDGLSVHQQRKTTGRMWMESMEFWFPSRSVQVEKMCMSSSVEAVRTRPAKRHKTEGTGVDVQLSQSVPVGSLAAAALSLSVDLPEPDAQEVRTLDIFLEPAVGEGAKAHTILAVPLGADVLSIEGPPPANQRLLRGYVAYYWKHTETPVELTIRLRVPDYLIAPLDMSELNP